MYKFDFILTSTAFILNADAETMRNDTLFFSNTNPLYPQSLNVSNVGPFSPANSTTVTLLACQNETVSQLWIKQPVFNVMNSWSFLVDWTPSSCGGNTNFADGLALVQTSTDPQTIGNSSKQAFGFDLGNFIFTINIRPGLGGFSNAIAGGIDTFVFRHMASFQLPPDPATFFRLQSSSVTVQSQTRLQFQLQSSPLVSGFLLTVRITKKFHKFLKAFQTSGNVSFIETTGAAETGFPLSLADGSGWYFFFCSKIKKVWGLWCNRTNNLKNRTPQSVFVCNAFFWSCPYSFLFQCCDVKIWRIL
jgi:hypothetical protein